MDGLFLQGTELAQHAEKNESASELAQVPELLQDMRHLQLDLEYHQQKLDQVTQKEAINLKIPPKFVGS